MLAKKLMFIALTRFSCSFSICACRAALRAIPILGAIGNGAYSYYDTTEVGKTAAAYFKALADQESQDSEGNATTDNEKLNEAETIN